MLTTNITPASVYDINYLEYCMILSRRIKQKINNFMPARAMPENQTVIFALNIADGIMIKDSSTAKLTDYEINRNQKISKVLYIVEQYFG